MIKNYLKVALRNLAKQKIISVLNLLGLSIGLASCMLIYLFVADELSYDRFHKNSDRIYRFTTLFYAPDGSISNNEPWLPLAAGPVLEEYFGGIKYSVRVKSKQAVLQNGDKIFSDDISLTDDAFFQMFSFPLLKGNPETVLESHTSIVLTESSAEKYFGAEDPIGKTLIVTMGQIQNDFIVTGIAADSPINSSIQYSVLANIECLKLFGFSKLFSNWGGFGTGTYVQLHENTSPKDITNLFAAFKKQYFGSTIDIYRKRGYWKGEGDPFSFDLQNIKNIHLDTGVTKAASSPVYSYILSGIAFIMLIIACINFMNLSVGCAAVRAVEIGIRKVIGAERRQLIRQFWCESILMAFIAMLMSLFLVELLLPVFNVLAVKKLSMSNFATLPNLGILFAWTVLVGIASGSYPALIMSRFQPGLTLKGRLKFGGKNFFTKSLVVIQFALSIFLIISTMIMGKQLSYMRHKGLGFDKEAVAVIDIQETKSGHRVVDLLKERLSGHRRILNISAANSSFGIPGGMTSNVVAEGIEVDVKHYSVDYDYLATLKIPFSAGREFSPEFSTDTSATIVNEKLVKELRLEAPLGKTIHLYGTVPLNIIGIVKDYHFDPIQNDIGPVMLYINPELAFYRYLLVRVSPRELLGTVKYLEKTWREIQPNKPFLYTFLDEDLETFYQSDKRWSAIVLYSSILAILISCLGLFGLTSLRVAQRKKEIGIRKVLGATISRVVQLISLEFIILVAVANLIAWPLAYYAMNRWIQNFAYRITIEIWIFFLAAALALIIALATVSFQSVKAALADPVKSLRYE